MAEYVANHARRLAAIPVRDLFAADAKPPLLLEAARDPLQPHQDRVDVFLVVLHRHRLPDHERDDLADRRGELADHDAVEADGGAGDRLADLGVTPR